MRTQLLYTKGYHSTHTERRCLCCDKPFLSTKSSHRFCSQICRLAGNSRANCRLCRQQYIITHKASGQVICCPACEGQPHQCDWNLEKYEDPQVIPKLPVPPLPEDFETNVQSRIQWQIDFRAHERHNRLKPPEPELKERTCITCGKKYRPKKWNQVHCRHGCFPKPFPERICRVCHWVFVPDQIDQEACWEPCEQPFPYTYVPTPRAREKLRILAKHTELVTALFPIK